MAVRGWQRQQEVNGFFLDDGVFWNKVGVDLEATELYLLEKVHIMM